jgi:hypothetical protein
MVVLFTSFSWYVVCGSGKGEEDLSYGPSRCRGGWISTGVPSETSWMKTNSLEKGPGSHMPFARAHAILVVRRRVRKPPVRRVSRRHSRGLESARNSARLGVALDFPVSPF